MGQSVDGVPIMMAYDIEAEEEKVEGSPYLYEDWKYFIIKRNNGAEFEAPYGNYHTYLNELIVRLDGKFHRLHDSRQIEYFEVDSVRFVNLSFEGSDEVTFAEQLVDSDKIQVLKKYACIIKRGKPSQGIVEATQDKYIRYEEYYVRSKTDETKICELKVKKRGAKLKDDDVFPNLASFLKEHKKENFKDDDNLKRILSKF
ncbi:hypothetical protein [Ekhidna sp.]|uniref:hypothetical protein n=1 Tax=Ekhidna sp. TaxID=2608089 RepID=UPI003B5A128A